MPTEQENLAAVEAFFRAYNEERIDDAAGMYSRDARVRHMTRGIDVTGRDMIHELMTKTLAMFPDRRTELVASVGSGDVVVQELGGNTSRLGSAPHDRHVLHLSLRRREDRGAARVRMSARVALV